MVSNRQSYFLAMDVLCFYLIMETLSVPETSDTFFIAELFRAYTPMKVLYRCHKPLEPQTLLNGSAEMRDRGTEQARKLKKFVPSDSSRSLLYIIVRCAMFHKGRSTKRYGVKK